MQFVKEDEISYEFINEMTNRFGSPLYVYMANEIRDAYLQLSAALTQYSSLSYSVKVNPNAYIIAELSNLGAGAEVSSAGELHIALSAGVSPDRIVFSGPGKTDEEIEFAVSKNVRAFYVESEIELIRINAISKSHGHIQDVVFRINSEQHTKSGSIRMSGPGRQFGISVEKLGEIIELAKLLPNVRPIGLFMYNGTQILDADAILRNTEYLLTLAAGVSEHHNMNMEILDFGGGFGIPYVPTQCELDLDFIRSGLDNLFNAWLKAHPDLQSTKFMFQSGRYLVGRAGYYITQIVDVKETGSKTFVIVDGGLNQFVAGAGIGTVMRSNLPLYISRLHNSPRQQCAISIVGSTCTPVDIFHSSFLANVPEPGDYVVIKNAGAYGLTFSPVYFCGHPTPAEVMVDYERHELRQIRRRGSFNDLLWATEV